jgi:acyl transferase domain-containing protein/acyl carrier protein
MNDKPKKSTSNATPASGRAELLKRALREIESLDAKLAAAEKVRNEPIAIIGMGCRFPAGANNPDLYWQMLEDGVDGITEVAPERWSVEEWYDPDPEAVGKAYTMKGGFIDDVDQFDATFFGVSPREAEQMDPQQRWLLQVAWEALEDAGLAPEQLAGSQTGVFVGMTGSDFLFLQTGNDPANIDTYVASGNSHAVAAGRLSYVLGFRGPAMTIDTACSSALLSVHLACNSLRIGECDTALAGGVLLLLSPGAYVTACKAKLLSPDGHCKTFDDSADGYVRAEGCAMVTLKRLSDAQRDGDNILAVIRGSACNQDGRSGGLTVPSGNAQEAVIRQALLNAGVSASEVSYVESHGTGTALGDPIEVQALDKVYSEQRSADQPLVIGSVKSNIGHTEALAGVAGLIKLILSLKKEKIPGDLHFNRPNTHVPWNDLSIEVADKLLEWPQWAERKIGGISSFGFSGTNVHMLVEQAAPPSEQSTDIDRPQHLLTLSARREAAVEELAQLYAARLAGEDEDAVADFCYSAATGRSHFEHRAAIRGSTKSELIAGLEELGRGARGTVSRSGKIQLHAPFNIGFIFPGEGSQRVNMGRVLFDTQPAFRKTMQECDRLLRDRLERPLLSVLYPQNGDDSQVILDDPLYAQPALFALAWALVEMWDTFGVTPSVVAGHGCGEIAAACAVGIMDFQDGLMLAAERGQRFSECDERGAMAVVNANADSVRENIAGHDGVEIAAINSPQSVVISGDPSGLDSALDALAGKGLESRQIDSTLPLQTPRMAPTAALISKAARQLQHGVPHADFVSMLRGQVATGQHAIDADYWSEQLQGELNVVGAFRAIRAHDCRALIEMGPGGSLLSMARSALPDSCPNWLPSLSCAGDDWDQTISSMATLYVEGMDIDWNGFDKGYVRRKVALPTYPFDTQSFPIKELAPRRQFVETESYLHPLVGRRFRSPQVSDWIWESRIVSDSDSFGDYCLYECPTVPATAFLEAMTIAGREIYPQQNMVVKGFDLDKALVCNDDVTVQAVATGTEAGGAQIEIYSTNEYGSGGSQTWSSHANSELELLDDAGRSEAPADIRAEWEQRCDETWRGAQLYDSLFESGLSFSPEYRLVESLQRRDGEVVAQIRVASVINDEDSTVELATGFVEACSHLLQVAHPGIPTLRPGAPLTSLRSVERFWIDKELPDVVHAHGIVQDTADGTAKAGDLQLFDPSGRLVGEMMGAVHGPIDPNQMPTAHEARLKKWLYAIDWKEENKSILPGKLDHTRRWLIFADGVGWGAAVAAELKSSGGQVELVTPGKSLQQTDGGWTLDPARPDEMIELVRRVQSDLDGSELSILYLWSLDLDGPKDNDLDPAAAVATACDGFLSLARAIVQLDEPLTVALTLVTSGAQPVQVGEGRMALLQTSFVGLQRVLASEHAELGTRIIDLDPDLDAAAGAARLVAELVGQDDNDDQQVALRGADRFVPRLVRSEATVADEGERSLDFGDGAFLVTGGLGGIGLSIASWLVQNGAMHVFLLGRSDATASAEERIKELAANGAEITVLKADISVAKELQTAIAKIDAAGVKLRGVFHAAGVLDDALLIRQDRKRFERVLRPKVNGTWNLHSQTAERELDFFVMFSAAAALFGNPGQSNYAAANLFLDGMAHYRRSLGLPGLSINWGAWSQVGMAAALGSVAHDRWAQLGVGQIYPQDGAEAMGLAMLEDAPQLAIMPINWAQWLRAFPGGKPPAFTSELMKNAGGGASPGPSVSSLLARISSADAERGTYLAQYVTGLLASLLGLVSESVDVEQPVSDLGFDSLMATTLKTQILKDLKIDIPVAAILDGPSVNDLADRLLAVFDSGQSVAQASIDSEDGPEGSATSADWEEGAL